MIQSIILIPTRAEYQAFLKEIENLDSQQYIVGKIKGYTFNCGRVFIACGGKGRLQFGLTAQYLLDRLTHISLLLCIGCAGSIKQSYSPGYIIIVNKIKQFDIVSTAQAKMPVFKCSSELIEKFYDKETVLSESIFLENIACGDEDIITKKRASEIAEKTGAVITAWESSGGASACRFHKVPYGEIRVVSDRCGVDSFEYYIENLASHMRLLADFLLAQDFFKKHHAD